jgi:PIN domain nuclease of toxin-antitoxin system
MTGLLDTHSFLWAVMAPEKLSAKIRSCVADKNNKIFISTITFWEISLKFSLGKLELTGCKPENLVEISRHGSNNMRPNR